MKSAQARMAAGLFAGALLLGGASTAEAGEQRWANYDRGLFLRSGPSRTHAIVGGVEYGEAVELLRVLPGEWGQVRRGDHDLGYVRANHLVPAPPPAKPITWCWSRHLYVSADAGVNVRAGPGTDFAVIGSLAYGEGVVDCKEARQGWTKVRDGLGLVGYVAGSYLGTSPVKHRLGSATTGKDGAIVYRARDVGAEVVTRLPSGTQLDALTGDWDGFMKVRLADTRTGFVLTPALRTGAATTSETKGILVFLFALAAAGLSCFGFFARRAVQITTPEAPILPIAGREMIVPMAVAPTLPLEIAPPPLEPPPFARPPAPGGLAPESDAASAYASAIRFDVSARANQDQTTHNWSIPGHDVRCVACRALPFDVVRLRGTDDARCFPCAWQAGWLDGATARAAWAAIAATEGRFEGLPTDARPQGFAAPGAPALGPGRRPRKGLH